MNIIKTLSTITALFSVFALLPANSATDTPLVAHRTSLGKWASRPEQASDRGANCQHLTALGFVNSTLNVDIFNDNAQDSVFQSAGQHGASYHTGVYNAADISPSTTCFYLDGLVSSDYTPAELQTFTVSSWSYVIVGKTSTGAYAVDGYLDSSYQTANQSDSNWFGSSITTTDTHPLSTWTGNFAPFMHIPLTAVNGNTVFAGTIIASAAVDLTSLPLPTAP